MSIDGIAGNRIVEIAIALLFAFMSKVSGGTFRLTQFPDPSGTARTFARLCIARTRILAFASLLTILAMPAFITRPITEMSFPSNRAHTLTRFRITFRTILTVALLRTILTVCAIVTDFVAWVTFVARSTGAYTVDRWTLGSVIAIASQSTILAVCQEWTRTIAQTTAPAGFAFTFARPRMAHHRIVLLTFARQIAMFAIEIVRTIPFRTNGALPTIRTQTFAIWRTTFRIVFAATRSRTIRTPCVAWTVIETFVADETRCTFALTGDVMTVSAIETLALLFAFLAIESDWTTIGAYVTRPTCKRMESCWFYEWFVDEKLSKSTFTWRTFAFTILRITFSVVLAFAFLFTFLAMFAIGTRLGTQRSSETGRTATFARNVMTFATIFASTRFRTIQSILTIRTFQFAFFASESLRTPTQSIELVARSIVLTLARMWTIPSPHTCWTFCKSNK